MEKEVRPMIKPLQQSFIDMEHQLNTLNKESLKTGVRIHKGKKICDKC